MGGSDGSGWVVLFRDRNGQRKVYRFPTEHEARAKAILLRAEGALVMVFQAGAGK